MKQRHYKYNFCGLKNNYSEKEKSHFLILPIPYEATTSYGKGTAQGPKAIIDASLYLEHYDEELYFETYTTGIHTLPFLEYSSKKPGLIMDELSDYVSKEINHNYKDKVLICLGGEHSLSPAIVKPFKQKYSDLSVLHFDAHADLKDSFQGTPFSHGCAVRRILEYCPAVSCGIRSLAKEEAEFIDETGQKIYFGKSALNKTNEIISLLSNNVYISLDVDVLDPSIIPSTGTPEPDGWLWHELCDFLKQIISSKNIVAIDIVELAPLKGVSAPDFTISKLIYRIMGYIALSKKWVTNKNLIKSRKE